MLWTVGRKMSPTLTVKFSVCDLEASSFHITLEILSLLVMSQIMFVAPPLKIRR